MVRLTIWKSYAQDQYMTISLIVVTFLYSCVYRELNLPPTESDGTYNPQTVQQFLDSLVEEIHISDDEFNVFLDKGNEDVSNLIHKVNHWFLYPSSSG